MRDAFAEYHPLTNFIYFGSVLLFAMFQMHPVCLAISLAGAFCNAWLPRCKKEKRPALFWMLVPAVTAMILQPLFSHAGVTILWYFPTGNALTLESIVYGIASGTMLLGVLLWFCSWNRVVTTDKYAYLLGWLWPSLSLVLSMVLRFLPRFRKHLQEIREARACLGESEQKGFFSKMRQGIRTLGSLLTWSLEQSVETADSMKARGYGLPGRTSFHRYRMEQRDYLFVGVTLTLDALLVWGMIAGIWKYAYFPMFQMAHPSGMAVCCFVGYGILCMLPLLADGWEEWKWNSTQSEI